MPLPCVAAAAHSRMTAWRHGAEPPNGLPGGAGDQAAHLQWRLEHGQLYRRRAPKVLVVMIGTNDLGAAACLGGAPAIKRAAGGPDGAAAR